MSVRMDTANISLEPLTSWKAAGGSTWVGTISNKKFSWNSYRQSMPKGGNVLPP